MSSEVVKAGGAETLPSTAEGIQACAERLREGRLVAFPTETGISTPHTRTHTARPPARPPATRTTSQTLATRHTRACLPTHPPNHQPTHPQPIHTPHSVYGLGANALNEPAVRNIFAVKGRPLSDPLIVHVVQARRPTTTTTTDRRHRPPPPSPHPPHAPLRPRPRMRWSVWTSKPDRPVARLTSWPVTSGLVA